MMAVVFIDCTLSEALLGWGALLRVDVGFGPDEKVEHEAVRAPLC